MGGTEGRTEDGEGRGRERKLRGQQGPDPREPGRRLHFILRAMGGSERERGRERHRQRQRETEAETEKERDREVETETEEHRDREEFHTLFYFLCFFGHAFSIKKFPGQGS